MAQVSSIDELMSSKHGEARGGKKIDPLPWRAYATLYRVPKLQQVAKLPPTTALGLCPIALSPHALDGT